MAYIRSRLCLSCTGIKIFRNRSLCLLTHVCPSISIDPIQKRTKTKLTNGKQCIWISCIRRIRTYKYRRTLPDQNLYLFFFRPVQPGQHQDGPVQPVQEPIHPGVGVRVHHPHHFLQAAMATDRINRLLLLQVVRGGEDQPQG